MKITYNNKKTKYCERNTNLHIKDRRPSSYETVITIQSIRPYTPAVHKHVRTKIYKKTFKSRGIALDYKPLNGPIFKKKNRRPVVFFPVVRPLNPGLPWVRYSRGPIRKRTDQRARHGRRRTNSSGKGQPASRKRCSTFSGHGAFTAGVVEALLYGHAWHCDLPNGP